MVEGIDIEQFVTDHVTIQRVKGEGLLIFYCPFCNDSEGTDSRRGRGFLNSAYQTAGCMNTGCDASPRFEGGAIEWVRRIGGFASRREAIRHLFQFYPGTGAALRIVKRRQDYKDWVKFPDGMRVFIPGEDQPGKGMFLAFAKRQWGFDEDDLEYAGAGYARVGSHSHRIIFPVIMQGKVVGYQGRSILPNPKCKYLTSRHGDSPKDGADCGRPADAMLWGFDDIDEGDRVVLVEGIADGIACNRRLGISYGLGGEIPTRGASILGTTFSSEKLALVYEKNPSSVIVALDNEPEAMERGAKYVEALQDWGIPTSLATWVGGKDAASGATLQFFDSRVETKIAGRFAL